MKGLWAATRDWRTWAGLLFGGCVMAALSLAVGARPPERARPEDYGAILSECTGALRELVIQYNAATAAPVRDALRDFLRALPEDVTVRVVCPDRRSFDEIRAYAGPVGCSLRPVTTGQPVTCWARDRWLCLEPGHPQGPSLILLPYTGEARPERRGDVFVGRDLARSVPSRIDAFETGLGFDGGDFLADDETVFVTPAVARRNLQLSAATPEDLRAKLQRLAKRPVVFLSNAPDHHAAMFAMTTGNRTALVGDPALARRLLLAAEGGWGRTPVPEGVVDFSVATQARFDAVAAQLEGRGYRVTRIPVLPCYDERTYVTYVNVIIDERAGVRTVYLPQYKGAEPLNEAAAATWRELGYTVAPVDCTKVFRYYGSLHCLVNVLKRG